MDFEKYIEKFNDVQKEHLRKNFLALNEENVKILEIILKKDSIQDYPSIFNDETRKLYKNYSIKDNFNYLDEILNDLFYSQPMFSDEFYEKLGIPKGVLD